MATAQRRRLHPARQKAVAVRQPRPSDVLEAVAQVAGRPLGLTIDGMRVRRDPGMTLACHSLYEICGLNQSAMARVLQRDRTTVRYHLNKDVDYDAVRMVVQKVSDQLEAEDLAEAQARERRQEARAWMG